MTVEREPPVSRSVYLGQFTDENADRILDALADAGIDARTKSSGQFTRFFFAGDWGVRIFVPEEQQAAARDIAGGIAPDGLA